MADLIPWAVGAALVAMTALGLFFGVQAAMRNPTWLYPIGKAIIKDIIIAAIPLVKPRNYTEQEKAKMRAGGEAGLPGQKPQHDTFKRYSANPAKKPLTLPPKKRNVWTREK